MNLQEFLVHLFIDVQLEVIIGLILYKSNFLYRYYRALLGSGLNRRPFIPNAQVGGVLPPGR